MQSFTSYQETQTHKFGAQLAELLDKGDLILMTGDLGAGKTILSKGIAAGLGVTETVTSPTFAIANVYQGRLELHHLDVYRFNSPVEVYEAFDISEMLDSGIVLVEWGELILEHLGDTYLELKLRYGPDENTRIIEPIPHGLNWENRLQDFMSNVGVK